MNRGFLTVGSSAIGLIGCAVPDCEHGLGDDLWPLRLDEGTLVIEVVLCTFHRVELDPDDSLLTYVRVSELREATR